MSVKLKIFFGMGLLVMLLVGVGVVAAALSNRLTEIFTQYRGVSQINQLANSMSEDMFEASLASLAMRSTGDGAKFDEFRSHIEDVRAAQSELQNMVTDPDIQGLVLGLTPKIDDYENALLSATGLFADLNTVFLQIKTHGQTARKDLTEAMRLSKSGDDPEGAYATGLGVKHLLLGRLYFERFVTSSDQADLARSQEELGIAETLLQDEWQALGTQQNRLKQDVLGNLALFRTDMANAGVLIEQRNATFAQMYEIRPSMLADVDAIVEGLVARQVILGTQGGDATQNAKLIISMVSLAGVLLGLALAFFIGRSITQPILRITRNMTEMADGDLQVVIEGQDNKHEIGTMARALEVFRARTMEVQDLLKARENDKKARAEEQKLAEERNRIMEEERQNAKDREAAAAAEQRRFAAFATFREDLEALITAASNGDFSVRLTETLEDRELNNLAQIMNELLTLLHGSMEDLRVHMTKLATGQLTARMQGERKGAFKELQDSFNSTIDALYGTVSQISTSGGSVSNTASELEAASVAMSKRAEANAASLEETSAAVEEISNSLESVVENSKKASASTIRARDNAENGRVVANATREAMTRMSDASNRIGKVVGVIEEISFQINLLALNAGVEAARAGESGRGFSVVASEVRALALRSQEAVSEINDVIGENLNSVETSVEQVQKSQDAMEEIISEVIVASGQISEIASAVEQQSSGLQEINRAIQSIDSSAQSDAASIEELTASSKTLSKEAKSLQDTLAHFEVEDSTRPDTELSRVG